MYSKEHLLQVGILICIVPYNNMIKYNNLSIGELWDKYFTGVLRQPRKLEIKSEKKKELLIPLPKI